MNGPLLRAERTPKDQQLRQPSGKSWGNKYVGRACPRCGGTVRYLSTRHCVTCKGEPSAWTRNANRTRRLRTKIAFVMRNQEAW